MDQSILHYLETHKQQHLDELCELLRIESVSADPKRKDSVRAAGQWCVDLMKRAGLEHAALHETGGQPAAYADWLHAGADKPTILIYGHFDVQPEDPLEKWHTKPFEPVVKDGHIWARGSSDDKGQMLTHLFALEAWLKTTGKLPVNVKVFLEGEEEGGTGATERFVEHNRKLLACDAVVIADTSWHAEDVPSMVYALRGMCYLEVRVKGPSRDLHSGVYGGKVQNPLNAIAKIIAKLQDEDGKILIPGWYDDVVQVSDEERASFAKVADDERLKQEVGVKELWGEKGFTTEERCWARPSLDVHGIWGGFSGAGAKTVIAAEGGFKVSSRLVANQDPEKCMRLITDYITSICPPGVTAEVIPIHIAYPVMVPTDNPFVNAAQNAFEKGFGKRPILLREGASIPIAATFLTQLKAPSIFLGFGLNSDNLHSPNENWRLDHFYKGMITNAHLYQECARVSR